MDDVQHLGYLVNLDRYQLREDNTGWIHAFAIGEYQHPLYGKIKMSAERASRMAANVMNGVRGVDLAIDYGHRSEAEAAGWVKGAEARANGLWLLVEWTKKAAQKIRDKEYRYFSPEFVNSWKHPESGETFKDVVLGGGLTNRPFLKNMIPVNLTEMLDHESVHDESNLGGENVEELLKKLSESLKLAEDASEDDVLEAVTKLMEPPKEDPEPKDDVQELAEDNPIVKSLVEQVAALRAANRLSEASRKIESWNHGDKWGLPVALNDSARSFMLSADEKTLGAFDTFVGELLKSGLVKLGESGGTHERNEGVDLDKVDAGIKKLMEENEGMSYTEAATDYFRDNDEAFVAYTQASYAEGEGS